MKLEGALPIPTLTATVLNAIGRSPRTVVVHGSRDWKRRIAEPSTGERCREGAR